MNKFDFYNHLTRNIIPFWNKLKDQEYGGFFGYADCYGIPVRTEEKGVILNNRILWFYSNSYLLTKNKSYLEYADHAYSFTKNCCLDKENGGVYWSMDYKGNPKDTEKHTYNQAFAIYALSSYYKASKKKDALNLAMDLYHLIETKCKDQGGYLECFTKDFKPAGNEKLSENGVEASRTMNTLLHVLESYTELYYVSKNEEVKKSLYVALELFETKIYNPIRGICEVFFDYEYNTLIDLESYGHEIEASWLITRACKILEDEALLNKLTPMILTLADSPLERGMDSQVESMYYECENGIDLKKRTWWVEAEAVLGYYNAYQISMNEKYKKVSSDVFHFIETHIIDSNTGEWLEDYWDDPEKNKNQALVHLWKCPYHNGRMCIEMVKRLGEIETGDPYQEECVDKLIERLNSIQNEGSFLFGHQNTTFYAVSKKSDSDVRAMVGDLPGLFGIDSLALAGEEMDRENPENALRLSIEKSIAAYKEGCEITLSCHMPNFSTKNIIQDGERYYFHKCDFMDTKMQSDCIYEILPGGKYHKEFTAYLDLIVVYAKALSKEGIPVIFRPWHEQNGHWFWWGSNISDEAYKKAFRYTKEYMLENGVHNMLYVYSPNGPFLDSKEYLRRYPGDDIIDIMALDYYDDYMYKEPYREDFFTTLDASSKIVYEESMKHGKIPAISECGTRVAKDSENTDLNGILPKDNPILNHHWYTRIGEIAIKYHMPYYLVWGDFEKNNTYLPYIHEDGTLHELVPEFIEFYHWDRSIFAKKK